MRNKIQNNLKYATFITAVVIFVFVVPACNGLNTYLKTLKGDLLGENYQITEYDNFGNATLRVYGDKVNLKGDLDADGELTSYIDITIDGYEWKHVGSTLIFAQEGIDMITDFEIPDEIRAEQSISTGIMPVDRFINHYRNLFGQGQVVLISTQNGTPIGLFRGDDCDVTIPTNLPKVTLVNIDGKFIYIHRANVNIIPSGLFDNKLEGN